MKQVSIILIALILVPSMVLAYLAQRSLRDQEWVLSHQQRVLLQGVSDGMAERVVDELEEVQRDFALQIDALLAESDLPSMAQSFDRILPAVWSQADVGFAVTLQGIMTCPSVASTDPVATQFLKENNRFFCNQTMVEVYQMSKKGIMKGASTGGLPTDKKLQPKRKVEPEHAATGKSRDSDLTVMESAFSGVVGEAQEGILSRFLEDQLHVMVWRRLPQDPNLVLGARLSMEVLKQSLSGMLQIPEDLQNEIAVSILDETATPVARLPFRTEQDWGRPFVATEIGNALPHWEVAVYLIDSGAHARLARSIRWSMGAMLVILMLLIGAGSLFVILATQRRLTLARQQTDFVSNVSHELKTPLTSIRMFSEMLSEGRVSSTDKKQKYLQIIAGEADRLTRLINNVLDFSKNGTRPEALHRLRMNWTACIGDTVKNLAPGLEEKGFCLELEGFEEPRWIHGDADALSRVVVNLISNAEKYSPETKHLTIALSSTRSGVLLEIKDRGMGIPRGEEQQIFEQFYRAETTMKQSIQGSGLGLTLSRSIVEAHGGRIWVAQRPEGGSVFSIELPALESQSPSA